MQPQFFVMCDSPLNSICIYLNYKVNPDINIQSILFLIESEQTQFVHAALTFVYHIQSNSH